MKKQKRWKGLQRNGTGICICWTVMLLWMNMLKYMVKILELLS